MLEHRQKTSFGSRDIEVIRTGFQSVSEVLEMGGRELATKVSTQLPICGNAQCETCNNEGMRKVQQDTERIDLVREALTRASLDAVVCGLPQHVLMLSGYFPVVGSSLAIATRAGKVGLIVPTDEKWLADYGWADHVETFEAGSLKKLTSAVREVMEPLRKTCREFGLTRGSVGLETGPTFEPASYVAGQSYLSALRHVLAAAVPNVALSSAHHALTQLRAVLTAFEREHLRLACKVAQRAFEHGARHIRPGQRETEIAELFTAPLRIEGMKEKGVRRAGGEAFCMSGSNSAEPQALSHNRVREPSDAETSC